MKRSEASVQADSPSWKRISAVGCAKRHHTPRQAVPFGYEWRAWEPEVHAATPDGWDIPDKTLHGDSAVPEFPFFLLLKAFRFHQLRDRACNSWWVPANPPRGGAFGWNRQWGRSDIRRWTPNRNCSSAALVFIIYAYSILHRNPFANPMQRDWQGKDGFLRQCRIIPLAEHQRGNFKQGAATGGIHFLPHIFISVQEKTKKGCMLCLHGIRLFYHLKTPLSAVIFAASIIILF